MNKVYLVYCHKGMWSESTHYLHSICRDMFIAENKKREIQQKVDLLKLDYFIKTNRDYDKDKLNGSNLSEKHWSELLLFEAENEDVEIDTIYIKEMELL